MRPAFRLRKIGRAEPAVLERRCDEGAFIAATSEGGEVGKSLNAAARKQDRIRHRVPHVLQHPEIQSSPHPDAFQIQHDQRVRSGIDGSSRNGLDWFRKSTGAAVRDRKSSPQVETEHHALGIDGFADGLELSKGVQSLQADHDTRGVLRNRLLCRRRRANPCVDPERDAGRREDRQLLLLRSPFEDGIEIGGVNRGHAQLIDVGVREGCRIAGRDCRSRDFRDWLIGLSPAAARAHCLPRTQIDDADYLHG